MDAILHQPIVDAGDAQRRDVRGLCRARQRRDANRARQQFAKRTSVQFAVTHGISPEIARE
jgi:hypothetical protein